MSFTNDALRTKGVYYVANVILFQAEGMITVSIYDQYCKI